MRAAISPAAPSLDPDNPLHQTLIRLGEACAGKTVEQKEWTSSCKENVRGWVAANVVARTVSRDSLSFGDMIEFLI